MPPAVGDAAIIPLDGDPLVIPSQEELYALKVAKLARQEAERKEERDRRRGEEAEKADPRESAQAFLLDFGVQQQSVEESLKALEATTTAPGGDPKPSPPLEPKQIQEALDALTARVFQVGRHARRAL